MLHKAVSEMCLAHIVIGHESVVPVVSRDLSFTVLSPTYTDFSGGFSDVK